MWERAGRGPFGKGFFLSVLFPSSVGFPFFSIFPFLLLSVFQIRAILNLSIFKIQENLN
jgi:hypothetical protein